MKKAIAKEAENIYLSELSQEERRILFAMGKLSPEDRKRYIQFLIALNECDDVCLEIINILMDCGADSRKMIIDNIVKDRPVFEGIGA